MEKREIGRQEGSRGRRVGINAGPHEGKTSSREGSGAHAEEGPGAGKSRAEGPAAGRHL